MYGKTLYVKEEAIIPKIYVTQLQLVLIAFLTIKTLPIFEKGDMIPKLYHNSNYKTV